jgi:hypothetical protein
MKSSAYSKPKKMSVVVSIKLHFFFPAKNDVTRAKFG